MHISFRKCLISLPITQWKMVFKSLYNFRVKKKSFDSRLTPLGLQSFFLFSSLYFSFPSSQGPANRISTPWEQRARRSTRRTAVVILNSQTRCKQDYRQANLQATRNWTDADTWYSVAESDGGGLATVGGNEAGTFSTVISKRKGVDTWLQERSECRFVFRLVSVRHFAYIWELNFKNLISMEFT